MYEYAEDYISSGLKKMADSGELEKNPYRGKPLDLSGYFKAPKETRAINRFLADAGFKPPKLELLSKLRAKEDEYFTTPSPELRQEIINLRLRYDVLQ